MNLYRKFIFPSTREAKTVGILGVLGVFVGVFSIITVISVMLGFQKRLVDRIIGTEPHIMLYSKDDIVVSNELADEVKSLKLSDVLFVSPIIETETVFYMDRTTTGGIVFASSNEFMKKLLNIEYSLKTGEAILGRELASRNDLFVDDRFEALSVWRLLNSSELPSLANFKVRGFVRTGSFTKDASYIYINIADALEYFSTIPDMPQAVGILIKEPLKLDRITDILKQHFKDIKLETWKTRNHSILLSLKMERLLMLFVLLFVLLLASFAVFGSIMLDLESRKRDFALLRSLGLKKSQIKKIIIYIAIFRSSIGAILGGTLASVLCVLIEKYKFIHLPVIYYDPILPMQFSWFLSISITLLAILLSLVGVIFAIKTLKLPIITQIKL